MAIRSSKHTHLYQPMVETIRLGATKVQPFNPPILRISIRKNPPWAPKHEVLVHAVLPALAYAILELVKCLTHLLLVKKKQTLAFHGTFYPFSTFESPKSCHINLVSKITQTACSRTYQTSRCWRLWDFGRSSGRCASSLETFSRKESDLSFSDYSRETMLIFGGEILIHGRLSACKWLGQSIFFTTIRSSINWCLRRGEMRTDFNSDGQRITSSSSSNLGFCFQNSNWRKSVRHKMNLLKMLPRFGLISEHL